MAMFKWAYDLYGREVNIDKIKNPYSYGEHVIWQKYEYDLGHNFTCSDINITYSDRLYQSDSIKFNNCCEQIWSNIGQYFDRRDPQDIQEFLRLYFDNPTIELVVIAECTNHANGYPIWIFGYKFNI